MFWPARRTRAVRFRVYAFPASPVKILLQASTYRGILLGDMARKPKVTAAAIREARTLLARQGGKARAASLTEKELSEAGRRAATARWSRAGKKGKKKGST